MINSISDIITAPWKIHVVFTAVRLRIFSFLSHKSLPAADLSALCGAVTQLFIPLLEACVSMGLLEKQNQEYRNSQFSQTYLVEGESLYIGDLIELQQNEQQQWNKLYEVILTADNKKTKKISEADKHATFIKAMNNLGMLGEAEALVKAVDLSGCRTMVDVGGGSGLYSLLLCQKYPDLKTILLDKLETLAVTKEILSVQNEKERIILREADIEKDSYGEDIDVVLLSDVIYDELSAQKILPRAWRCLSHKGKLIIRGYYSDPENLKPLFGALFVINQMVFDSTRKILVISSLQKEVIAAGFHIEQCSPLTERSCLLVAIK